ATTTPSLRAVQSGKRLFADWFLEIGQRVLRELHFGTGQQEGERGFRPLISVDPVHVQSITAAAGSRGVEFESEIVPAEEPVEGAMCLIVPTGVIGRLEGL